MKQFETYLYETTIIKSRSLLIKIKAACTNLQELSNNLTQVELGQYFANVLHFTNVQKISSKRG